MCILNIIDNIITTINAPYYCYILVIILLNEISTVHLSNTGLMLIGILDQVCDL